MPSIEQKTVIKIDQAIVSYKVITTQDTAEAQAAIKAVEHNPEKKAEPCLETVHENLSRPDFLMGSTYKIKTPMSEHALYITINDIVLNQDTPHEQRHPYEIFINSKNMDHFMWVVALTRVISAVFRKGGDVTFMVEELKAVFDPKGGYFKKGGKFMPSLVAEIGESIENHLKMIGLIKDQSINPHQQKILDEKRAEFDRRSATQKELVSNSPVNNSAVNDDNGGFPANAKLCNKCHTKAAILMDGCYTCLSCGDSKCS
ncbi:NrdJb [Neptunomonas japonica]|uniref:TSCPD domain-containing protein n=1 Tax=Neptunomonas japonica TaxID=417574 RepID=UPI0004255481|nr:NrdJb [Neptunomonas japonica]